MASLKPDSRNVIAIKQAKYTHITEAPHVVKFSPEIFVPKTASKINSESQNYDLISMSPGKSN